MRDESHQAPTPAQSALREALVRLLLEKPLARIGVKELCAAAHVARSTFYAYYDNTDELLREIEDGHVAEIAQLNAAVSDPRVRTPDDMRFFDATIAYVQAHERDFRALLVTDPSPRFASRWQEEIKRHLRLRRSTTGLSPLSPLTEEVAAGAVVSAVACLLRDPAGISPDDVHEVLAKALAALDS